MENRSETRLGTPQEDQRQTMDGACLPRHLVAEVEEALASARVVDLAGKTTLVRDMLGHGRFMTLDDSAALSAIDVFV